MNRPYLAHRREDTGEEQLLLDHLQGTAKLAGEFGKSIHAEQQAYRCGLLHDIGKYSEAFDRRIHGANISVDHSTAGAVEAKKLGDIAAAFAIAGHHAGIPDGGSKRDEGVSLNGRLSAGYVEKLPSYQAFRREVEVPRVSLPKFRNPAEAVFFTRMLYSGLVPGRCRLAGHRTVYVRRDCSSGAGGGTFGVAAAAGCPHGGLEKSRK